MTSLFENPSSPPLVTRTGGAPASQRPNQASGSLLTQSTHATDQVRSPLGASTANTAAAKSSGPRPLLAQARPRSGAGASSAGLSSIQSGQLFLNLHRDVDIQEGLTANRPLSSDPGGLTHRGISQRFLDSLRKQKPHLNLPSDPRQITSKQRLMIFRTEFFDRANIPKIAGIPGVMQRVPKLVGQIYDSSVLHGPENAGKLLQRSLDKVLGTDLRISRKGKKEYDGIIGSNTRAAIAQAAHQNKLRAVNNEMAKQRERFMRQLPNFNANPGWVTRARSFQMP